MKKKIFNALILCNQRLAENVWRMVLKYPEDRIEARPGQFVNVYINSKDMLLPRPISICRQEGVSLTLVYGIVGKGTRELSSYRPGTLIRASTPLGNGYDLNEMEAGSCHKPSSALMIGGGIGVPPLLELGNALIGRGLKVDAVFGFREEPFLTDAFSKLGMLVHVATDNGSEGFHGDVIKLIERKNLTADYYFACGPKPMLKAISAHCASKGKEIQVSIEERMGCGYGACVGCTCKIRASEEATVRKKVCKDGPVFRGKEVVWDE